jgi:hypothetical protein
MKKINLIKLFVNQKSASLNGFVLNIDFELTYFSHAIYNRFLSTIIKSIEMICETQIGETEVITYITLIDAVSAFINDFICQTKMKYRIVFFIFLDI